MKRITNVMLTDKMRNERIRKMCKAERVGKRRRGRPRIGWLKGIGNILKGGLTSTRCKKACMRARMIFEEAKDVREDKVPLCLSRERHGVIA
jgi:hypothetical protein